MKPRIIQGGTIVGVVALVITMMGSSEQAVAVAPNSGSNPMLMAQEPVSPEDTAPSEASSERDQILVGHWRKTTIVFESPRDEHLVLHADGTVENWVVTASSRSATTKGTWNAEGKILNLALAEGTRISQPFTFYEGQLVFPNIPKRRGFWEKLGR